MKQDNTDFKSLITLDLMKQAAMDAFVGHNKKPEIKKFKKCFNERCTELHEALIDGTWKRYLKYTPLVRVNTNGKVRHILSPSLITRIYQHLLLNLLEPIYFKKDNRNGLNCKKGAGITAKDEKLSVIHKLKHLYYDRRDLNYVLFIDQRKCYDHLTEKWFRRSLKMLITDKWMIDFAVDVCYINKKLPIGTPTSPFIHHVMLLQFDYFAKSLGPFSIRYADDNLLAFETREEAHQAMWRIKNYWWYVMGIRSKRHTTQVHKITDPCNFCGYVIYRNPGKGVCDHNKGYVKIRENIKLRAKRCNRDESWSSYFGLLSHADCYNLMAKIERTMKLRELTAEKRIVRNLDAKNIDIKELASSHVRFTIYDYELRYEDLRKADKEGRKPKADWVKCIIGIPDDTSLDPNGMARMKAFEFHGSFTFIAQFMEMIDTEYGKEKLLPIEEVWIENQCGYIIGGSTEQKQYIDEYEKYNSYQQISNPFDPIGE